MKHHISSTRNVRCLAIAVMLCILMSLLLCAREVIFYSMGTFKSLLQRPSRFQKKTDEILLWEDSDFIIPNEINNESVIFQFLIGVEGAGHHLHRSLYLISPAKRILSLYNVEEDVDLLSVSLWDKRNFSNGIWSAPCSSAHQNGWREKWWKYESPVTDGHALFTQVVSCLENIQKKIVQARIQNDDSRLDQRTRPLFIPINSGAAGNTKIKRHKVAPLMSYPMLGGPCRPLQYPNLDILYKACDSARVQCQHSVIHRNPYRTLRSTSMHRHFASRQVQLATLLAMQHVILSQMYAHPDRLLSCWQSDEEMPSRLGNLFGWRDHGVFRKAYQSVFIPTAPITAMDKIDITHNGTLEVYTDMMVEANNRIKDLCIKQRGKTKVFLP